MNLGLAHRFGERVAPSRVAARFRGGLVCLTLGLVGPAFAGCGSPAGMARVVGVNERLEIALEDGRLVRLAGLQAPDPLRGAPETAKAARDFLIARLLGRNVEVGLMADGTDRWGQGHGRSVPPRGSGWGAQVNRARALRAGFARVWPEFETRGCSAPRLAIEDGARRDGLGMWRYPEYSVIESSDASELRKRDGQFVVIEGRVRRVGFGRSRLYLDLDLARFGGPTIVIARKLEPAFERAGRPLGALVAQTIRARGALDDRFGPRIEVSEPAMIELYVARTHSKRRNRVHERGPIRRREESRRGRTPKARRLVPGRRARPCRRGLRNHRSTPRAGRRRARRCAADRWRRASQSGAQTPDGGLRRRVLRARD